MRKYEYECNCVSTVEYEPTYCKLRQYVVFCRIITTVFGKYAFMHVIRRTYGGLRI